MSNLVRKLYSSFRELLYVTYDLLYVCVLKRYPIKYFDKVPNVGDQINPYIVERLSSKPPYNVKSSFLEHVVGLGSMFHMANKRSIVWGTGIISNSPSFISRVDFLKVIAVRGHLTREIVAKKSGCRTDAILLGDPGVLMPWFYQPSSVKNKKVGVVPHYVDSKSTLFLGEVGFEIIDVSLDPESFIDKILSCEFIISSSLHGLILSDAYGVPNKWVVFSDQITGGEFKYHDYYSTTDKPEESCVLINSKEDLNKLVCNVQEVASIKRYVFDRKKLLDSFPKL